MTDTTTDLRPVPYDENRHFDVEFKMVLLGATGVGKTAILRNFIEKRTFDETVGTVNTIGGCYSSVVVNTSGHMVRLKCWDTGGQERHASLTASYYRGAAVALVVFAWTDRASWDAELVSVKYWVSELKRNNSECDIVLVGNKYDVAEDSPELRAISEAEVAEYARELGAPLVSTSAKSGKGVHLAFKTAIDSYLARGITPLPVTDDVVIEPKGGKEKEKEDKCTC